MKHKAFRSFIFLVLLLTLIVLLYIQIIPVPVYSVKTSLINESSIEQVNYNEGKRLAITICSRCHYNPETKALSGRKHGNPERLGEFWSSNISNDTLSGIGSWSREELVWFLRTGIKNNGEYVYDMPKYNRLSDNDMASLISFLKSDDELVRATKKVIPKPKYSWISKALLHFWLRPPEWDGAKVRHPDSLNPILFGQYLATAKFACFDCHSGNMAFNDYINPSKSWRYFEGGNPHANELGEKVYSSNLTPSEISGIGKWSRDNFINTLITGVRADGSVLRDPMFPFSMLKKSEASAIYDYLHTLDPVENDF